MKPLASLLLPALGLLAFPSAARAAAGVSPNDSVEAWSQSLGLPEGFTRMADGSHARRPGTPEPVAAAAESRSGPRAAAPLIRRSIPEPRRDAAPVPELKAAFVPAQTRARDRSTVPLAAGMTAAAGVCLVLLLGGASGAPASEPGEPAAPAPLPAPVSAAAAAREAHVVLEGPPPAAPPATPARLDEPFVDTRMPVATWRAIARGEQALIERWDASREKAEGRASFEVWLDRQGAVAGVDVARLKAKLARA